MTAARTPSPFTPSPRTGAPGRCPAPAPPVRGGRRAGRGHVPPRPVVRVVVGADLDAATGPRLVGRVADLVRCGADVALDTTAVRFVDCAGLATLERCALLGPGRVALVTGPAVERLRDLVRASTPSSPEAGSTTAGSTTAGPTAVGVPRPRA